VTAMSRRAAGAVVAAIGLAVSACSSLGAPATPQGLSSPSGPPITVGISLPLTGDFAADGQASERGYQLWASDVNAHGGLLHRPVRLLIRNDRSDPRITARDYTTLITQDHVDLTLAPFSSLLTVAAAPVAAKYHYAMAAGSAGAPAVYQLKLASLFSTTPPIADEMVPFAQWVLSLPPARRPSTAAYASVNDPFAVPPVQTVRQILEQGGIRTVYSHAPYTRVSPAALQADAAQVAAAHPQIVVLGSVDVPTVAAFVTEFERLHYNPQLFIAPSGPDQGEAFLSAVGTSNATGIMVSNGWYGSYEGALSHLMVQDYIAKYGGTASDINADVAEAYSAGEVMAAGVTGTGSLDQQKIIAYLHRHQVETVVGPARFGPYGQNERGVTFIFQWQPGARFVQVLPLHATGSVPIIPVKPPWAG
jgi:branched-chain amino acid transport system substrate-binding protein